MTQFVSAPGRRHHPPLAHAPPQLSGRIRPSAGGMKGPHEGLGRRAHLPALALHRDEHHVPDPVLPGRPLFRRQAGEGSHRGSGPGREPHDAGPRPHAVARGGRDRADRAGHGRQDRPRAERLFNQALVLSNLVGLTFGLPCSRCGTPTADGWPPMPRTAALGVQYLDWFVPALFLQFPLVGMGAALRGVGDIKMPTSIQIVTVVINIVLAPTLMFGWVTGASARRRGRRPRVVRRRRDRVRGLHRLLPAAGEPPALPPRGLASRAADVVGDAAHRAARGRRVRAPVRCTWSWCTTSCGRSGRRPRPASASGCG